MTQTERIANSGQKKNPHQMGETPIQRSAASKKINIWQVIRPIYFNELRPS